MYSQRLRSIYRSLFQRRRAESDLDDELRDHLGQEIENNIRAGMPPQEARFAALRLIGSISLYKDECRDARSISFIENLARDLRYALRTLRRTPLFSAAAILTLALGIGANATVFTFVENIVLRSLPARHPQQLVSISWDGMSNVSYPNYLDFRDRNTVFSNLIASRFNPVNLSIRARENFRVWGYEVSGNYFQALGISPELGRFFTSAEDTKTGANPVIVLSDRYWRAHLAADPHSIGRAIKINGYSFTIIGIAPPGFTGTELIVAGDYWVPMSMEAQIEPGNESWLRQRGSEELWVMGRLKPAVTRAQAAADLSRVARELIRAFPNETQPRAVFKLPRPGLVGSALRGPITSFGAAFMGVACATLLLACINLAGMLLAHASDRHREIGIRLAIGATRFQLLRQLMVESLLLALSGGILGLAIAFAACDLFSSWRPGFDLPINTTLHPDTTVLFFALAAALLTTLLFGLAPALHAVRVDVMPSLRNEPVSRRFRRLTLRDLLVSGQIALSMILVISSVLVVRSLQHALTMNLGFNPRNAVAVSFDLQLQRYDQAHSRRFDAELLEKAAAIPGLQSVGVCSNLPLRIGEDNSGFSRMDRHVPARSWAQAAIMYYISPGYLRTAGTRLLLGRDIDTSDREGAPPVAIVNEAVINVLYPHESPIGKRLRLGTRDKGIEIVGVVETGKYEFLGEDPHPAIFLPIAQTGTGWTTFVARTFLSAQQATELLRKAVLDLDPQLTLFNTGSLEDQLAFPLFPARAAAIVLGVFGVLAIVLAATGLFALVAYSVSRRTREIGIRMALGARATQVLSSILRRTLALCAIGLLIGTATALIAARLLSSILYGISPQDPAAYATALLIMAAVSLIACWNPASRAVHVDPARTLREQ